MDKLTRDVLIGLAGTAVGTGIGVAVGYGVWGTRPAAQITPPRVPPTGAPFPSKQRPAVTFRPGVVPTIPTKSVITSVNEDAERSVITTAEPSPRQFSVYEQALTVLARAYVDLMAETNRSSLTCRRLAVLPDRGANGAAFAEAVGLIRTSRALSMAMDGRGVDYREIVTQGARDVAAFDLLMISALKATTDSNRHGPNDVVVRGSFSRASDYVATGNVDTVTLMRDFAVFVAEWLVRTCPTYVQPAAR